MCARVHLRQWQESDLDRFAEMNTDPEVMRHFPRALSAQESTATWERYRTEIDKRGWGLWAVEVEGLFAGLTGLSPVGPDFPFGPAVEIAWRFRREYWGKGIALAAARDAEIFAFQTLKLPALVAFTPPANVRSRALMEKLGMLRDLNGDFLHPRLPEGHPLRRHVLYRKSWL